MLVRREYNGATKETVRNNLAKRKGALRVSRRVGVYLHSKPLSKIREIFRVKPKSLTLTVRLPACTAACGWIPNILYSAGAVLLNMRIIPGIRKRLGSLEGKKEVYSPNRIVESQEVVGRGVKE